MAVWDSSQLRMFGFGNDAASRRGSRRRRKEQRGSLEARGAGRDDEVDRPDGSFPFFPKAW